MFKIADDLESNGDFSDIEFSEDFPQNTSDTPRCKEFAAKTKALGNESISPREHLAGLSRPKTAFVAKSKTSPFQPKNKLNGQKTSRDDRTLPSRCKVNPLVSSPTPLEPTRQSCSVQSKDLDFLASWNNDDFFNPVCNKPTDPPVPTNRTTQSVTPVVTRQVHKTVRQRRFPGPAGLLPPRHGSSTSLIAPEEFLNELRSEENDPTLEGPEILSQNSGSIFEGGAWSAMLDDLGPQGRPLLSSMNLASIKSIGRNLRGYKVPFLAVLVQSIDASLPDAAVIFKDPTGEMHGVIHRDVWDQFNTDIAVGTVLVLRNVGIISAGTSNKKHVVNITGKNLTAIYSPKDELNVQLRQIHTLAANDSPELLAEWKRVERQTATLSPISRMQQPASFAGLFNSHQPCGGRSTLNIPISRAHPPSVSTSSPISAIRKPATSISSPFSPLPSRQQPCQTTKAKENKIVPNPRPSSTFAVKAPSNAPFRSSCQQNADRINNPNSSSNNFPSKKTKTDPPKDSATPLPKTSVKTNPFQVEADTSVVDYLLDGIDTDSLFGEF